MQEILIDGRELVLEDEIEEAKNLPVPRKRGVGRGP
jgi:hypothetical protein